MTNTTIKNNYKKGMSDLALSETYVPDIPKDIIFPDELNAYLRDQIQYLTHENGMLTKNLTETEVKLEKEKEKVLVLTKQVKQYDEATPANNFASVSNIASTKIVELSKKLRERSSELESVKTKCSKLEYQLRLLQQKEEISEEPQKEEVPLKPALGQEDDFKHLQDKLNSVTSKLFEAKNANIQLKNDLKLANKFLQQEIGDNFETLQSITNNGSWRGRAQVICDLQQKNNELREKLKQLQEKKPDMKLPEPSINLKSDRRIEILSKENVSLKHDVQDFKKKLDGARARNKTLESENAVLKTKMSMFADQQENDRQLIAMLTGQLATIKNVQNDDAKQKDQTIMKLQRECKNLNMELSKEQCRYENMKREFEAKLKEIKGKQQSRPPSSTSNANTTDDMQTARLEAERLRLLELTEITKKRLNEERQNLTNLQMQFKAERQKNAKLEAKIARMELDNSGRQSMYSLISSRNKEDENTLQDKLELAEENVKALKTRLDMEKKERELDFQEFSHILKNYSPISSEQSFK